VNQAALAGRLKEILARVVSKSGTSRARTAAEIDNNADFATLGVSSVDLMEFVLNVEQEFNVSLLDAMLPDQLPTTLEDWAKLVSAQTAGPGAP
jgi:acyl carrier protein